MRGARDRPTSRWAWAAGRRPPTSWIWTCSCASRPSATGWRASCASTACELSCVNAAGNPLHPQADVGARHAALVRGAIELAPLRSAVDRVVTMSGCPGGRDGGGDAGVRALGAHARRRVACGSGSSSSAWRRSGASCARGPRARRPACGSASSCTRARPRTSSASFLRSGRARRRRTSGVNFDPSHFWWQGIDPLRVIERASATAIGFAHGKDTLVARRPRAPQRPARLPLPGRPR